MTTTERTCTQVEIQYHTRDLGYGSEDGFAHAYVTDEWDAWGKQTLFVTHNGEDFERWYLFQDEWEYV